MSSHLSQISCLIPRSLAKAQIRGGAHLRFSIAKFLPFSAISCAKSSLSMTLSPSGGPSKKDRISQMSERSYLSGTRWYHGIAWACIGSRCQRNVLVARFSVRRLRWNMTQSGLTVHHSGCVRQRCVLERTDTRSTHVYSGFHNQTLTRQQLPKTGTPAVTVRI